MSAPTKQSKIMEAKIRAMNMPFSRRRPGSHAVNTKKRRTGYLPGEHHNINPSTSAINEEYDARERDMRKAQQVSTFNTWIKSSVRREQQRQNMEDFMDQEMIVSTQALLNFCPINRHFNCSFVYVFYRKLK